MSGWLWVAVCVASAAAGMTMRTAEASSVPGSVYFVGNSLTWDTRPHLIPDLAAQAGLDLETGFFVRANSSLAQSWEARDTVGGPESTHPSLVAGLSESWDAVVFQP
ncbi:MAG: hypothetical protein AAF078_13745, partial [Planctomycetota bacterium]